MIDCFLHKFGFFTIRSEGELDTPILELVRDDIAMACLLNLEDLYRVRILASLYPPDTLVGNSCPQPWRTCQYFSSPPILLFPRRGRKDNSHSRKVAAKLTHMSAFHFVFG